MYVSLFTYKYLYSHISVNIGSSYQLFWLNVLFFSCLQETGWDYQRALFIFNQLQSEGKIPPDAFVKWNNG